MFASDPKSNALQTVEVTQKKNTHIWRKTVDANYDAFSLASSSRMLKRKIIIRLTFLILVFTKLREIYI